MSENMILVTCATGKTGSRVAKILVKAGHAVRAVSRRSTLPFDWEDDRTWSDALDGVDSIYIVHPGLGRMEAALQVSEFAKVAVAKGATRAVLASTPDDGSDFSNSVRAAEQGVVSAGLVLTSLRLRWFNQNFSEDFLLDPVLSGELRLPTGTGKEAFVDADDIAAVASLASTDEQHGGKYYELTGPRLLGFADVAEEISRVTERRVRYAALSTEEYVAEQISLGIPEGWAHTLGALYTDIANHKLESISGDVEHVLGRPARDFRDFATIASANGLWNSVNH